MGQFTKHNNDKNSHRQMTYLPRGRSVQRKGDGKGEFTMPTWFQPSIRIAGLHRGAEVRQGSVKCEGRTLVEGTFVTATVYRLPPMHQAPSRHLAYQASFNSQEKNPLPKRVVSLQVLLLRRAGLRDARTCPRSPN